jgi:protein-glutamine gamma-glutamyltransferase
VPDWGTSGRSALMAVFSDQNSHDFDITENRSLYEIAQGVTARARTPYQAVIALESWFREGGGFVYDESPPQAPAGLPALAYFLSDESKRGYCQHYAGAMAAMLRLLGIPSRVAAGFTSGTFNEGDKEWVVTDHNAHTWVEVWFPRFGWLAFDPTPDRGQLAATYSPYAQGFLSGDAAEAAGGALLEDLTGFNPQLAERIRAQADRPNNLVGTGIGSTGSGGAAAVVRNTGPSILLVLVVVLAGAFAAIVLLKALARSARFATRDPRGLASAYRRDVVGYLADQGLEVPASATLGEIGQTLDRYYAVDADRLVGDLTVARFGRPSETRAALRSARRELRGVRRRLRSSVGALARLRGAASLRSLTL